MSDPTNSLWIQTIAGECPRACSAVQDVGLRQETYTRNAQTQMKLFTGGKAVPHRVNVFEVSGGAWDVTWKRAVPPFDLSQHPQIAAQAITLGELGPLGADGLRWAALPDGVTRKEKGQF